MPQKGMKDPGVDRKDRKEGVELEHTARQVVLSSLYYEGLPLINMGCLHLKTIRFGGLVRNFGQLRRFEFLC